jgi:hypothetical protein
MRCEGKFQIQIIMNVAQMRHECDAMACVNVQLFSSMLDGEKCFQILGFDIFLDKNCKPYLLEINHNPSFKLPTQLDVEIKTAAMAGCLGIICNKYMPYPSEALGPKAPGDGNDGCRERSVSLDSAHAAASEAAAVAAVLERDREALFRNTGLGKRQLQQQEVFAPSSYTRLKSSNSEVAESSSPQIASLCTDASGGQVISSRDWSLKTLYDCVGSPPNTLQVPCVDVCLFVCVVLELVEKEMRRGKIYGGLYTCVDT